MDYKILKYLALFFIFSEISFSGAWTRKGGKIFFVPYYYFYHAEKYYDVNWKSRNLDNYGYFDSNGLGLYFEYGISDKLNFIGNTAILILNRWIDSSNYKTNKGAGDLEIGLKFKVFESGIVLSFQTTGIIPLYSTEREPLIGFGQYAVDTRILIAGGFKPFGIDSYFNFEFGLRKFLRQVADQVRFQILYGANLSGRWQGIVQLDGVNSIGTGSFATRFNPSIETDFVEGKLSISFAHRFTYKAWIQGGFFYDIYGKRIGVGRGFFIAYWIEI
ncbi:hypothetical protein JGI1_01342 [Candidatus Thermokryptus mobilis]|uniref:MetA-pathway of phenol degradation n=1 Tax=Candidatus Thermokryptus mobilis TaxID=1643428 RepID=A0A0S4N4P6_9BACT|nr:hypothetical protein [Candidatus Thermokryptus mobilis]CUU05819.1 hypothetical protein JGI1_01342 [Candidatus Thermokryptus mobilis]